MIPELMNCAHSGEGWCLDCMQAMIPRVEVAAALEELRSDWYRQKIEAIDPSEPLYPDQQGHNSTVESFVEDLDTVITKLGLAPEKDEANG